ncbi:1-phosphofructokinase family hexose kinase [Gordonia aurantiaca]|uniref:1-phosphofructokinase family hexose kinase n=1 Tax=Gordonia sp. B21 TaxID=3151852 RepID=UPI0032673082
MPHILTVTMNPALDIHSTVPQLIPGSKMRCSAPRYDPGGGGINVARTAQRLGISSTAIIVSGGFTGHRIESLLEADGLDLRVIEVEQPTRESLIVVDETSGECYRFVLPGPHLRADDEFRALRAIDACAADASHLVVSGSMPPGCSPGFFGAVSRISRDRGCLLVVDTSGAALHWVTGAYLIKPSVRELRDFVGEPLPDRASQIRAARHLIARNISQVVLVSLGAAGALAVTDQEAHEIPGVPVESAGTGVGSGDSMVAATTVALARGWSIVDAVRYGNAAGAAAMLTPGTEPPRPEDIDRLYHQVVPQTLSE